MIKTVSEINKMEIPHEGIGCEVKGYFFYYLADDSMCPKSSPCFLSASDLESDLNYILLPKYVGENVIKMDDTFGMLVGGKYAYYGLRSIVIGVIRRQEDQVLFSNVSSLLLERGSLRQEFKMPAENAGGQIV